MKLLQRQSIINVLDIIVYGIGFLSILVFLLKFGFYLNEAWNLYIVTAIQLIVLIFCGQELFRWLTASSFKEHFKNRWFENLIVIILAFYFIQEELVLDSVRRLHPELGIDDVTIAYLGITQLVLTVGELIRFLRNTDFFAKLSLTTTQIFCFSFAIPILTGTLFLKLPRATVDGITWIDALFTSTSAVCVTGLTVLNVADGFTPLGQFIICILFQVGGLGIMTLSLAFSLLFSGGLGLKERIMMGDIFSNDRMGEIGSILAKITAFTISVEIVGAIALYLSKGFSFANLNIQELYFSIFHAISAFCNAGFSLYQEGLATSIVSTNHWYGIGIMALITIGSLGFPVVLDLYEYFNPKKRTSLTLKIPTKLILVTTTLLLVAGTLSIYFFESRVSFEGLTWTEKIYQSSFLSIASRTAGFNIWPTEELSVITCLILVLFMWIGGSPMSTAGGIKNLTFAVAILAFQSIIRGKNHIEVYGREIYHHSIFKAFNIIFISMVIIFSGTVALIYLEPLAAPLDLFFEAVSAFCTVGLTRGVTADLSEPSKLILIGLMYTGRIGFITVLSSFFLEVKKVNHKLLKENIPIN